MARNNSPLGMQFRTCENFGESTDFYLVLSPKFSQIQKPHRKSFDSDSLHESATNQTQSCNNSSLRGRIADSHEAIQKNKIDCHESLRDSRNDGFAVDCFGQSSHNDESKSQKDSAQNPKFRSIIVGASGLSLGISIVVAIMLGIGAGVLMQKIFGVFWVLFLGVFWGIAAAVLNVYKVYKAELRDFETLANDPKYKNMNPK